MTTLTRQKSREIDQLAIGSLGITGVILMENAGRGCTDFIQAQPVDSVVLLCGKGNNAGDGFVIARQLLTRNIPAVTILLDSPTSLVGDARTNFDILCKLPASVLCVESEHVQAMLDELETSSTTAIIDCMVGTGGVGDPRIPFNQAIEWANAQQALRVAVDIPTGLDCDTGQPGSPTFRAHHTLTMVARKQGFALAESREYTGEVHVIDIGIPLAAVTQ